MEPWTYAALALALVMGPLGAWTATQNRRSPIEGLILGLFFGPIGVIVEALLPKGDRRGTGAISGTSPIRSIDDEGLIARIATEYREGLDGADPGWETLPFPRKRDLLRPIERRVAKEMGLPPTTFADLSAEARRIVLRVGK